MKVASTITSAMFPFPKYKLLIILLPTIMILATTVFAGKISAFSAFRPTSSRLLLYKHPPDIKITPEIIKSSTRKMNISSRNSRMNKTSPNYDTSQNDHHHYSIGSIKSEKMLGLLDYLQHPITPLILLIVFICFLVLYCFYKKSVVSTATSSKTPNLSELV